jgi:hypothetical protein
MSITTVDIAIACHEANKVLCAAIGDSSQKHWDDAEQWQRDSAIKGVEYKLANPTAAPWDQHNAWCDDKIAGGWKYGPVKDADAKTHPCLVAYAELPREQQAKDHLFCGIVDAMKPLLLA